MTDAARDPFANMLAALDATAREDAHPSLRLDPDRAARTGIPEFVLAERKTTADTALSLMRLADRQGRALASRLRPDQITNLPTHIPAEYELQILAEARIARVIRDGALRPETGGRIAVISAGASDRPVATEAAIVAEEMGCTVTLIQDVGVAGLHRLVGPLREIVAQGVDAIVVAAGMDGALPSVIAGLVAIPVIGLPVSVGYGYGGDGTAALMSMLQACAPGIAVVNIDNGVGAGSTAALIANRAAPQRGDNS